MSEERTIQNIISDMERLMFEYHELEKHKADSGDPNAMILGVEFLVAFEVKVLETTGLQGGFSYAQNGNQTSTMTLGLAARCQAFADEQAFGLGDDED